MQRGIFRVTLDSVQRHQGLCRVIDWVCVSASSVLASLSQFFYIYDAVEQRGIVKGKTLSEHFIKRAPVG